MMKDAEDGRYYACIDLKSFYASVECVERGLDPFTTNLVVADPDRTEATICLAITPAMKALGVKNRCRVFEIPKNIDYIMAKPRMKLYMQRSSQIYGIYLRHISPDDIHVYSIDECFIDLTPYMKLYSIGPRALARRLMDEVFHDTGICATAGIGTNLFLAKVALDIVAKHSADHMGYLDREAFLRTVTHHRPITDVWNIGRGTAARLARYGVYDLAGVAQLPRELLFREFGVNAEYLIDHAHGMEPCTIADIKAYRSQEHSITNSQVLFEPYSIEDGRIILREMVEASALKLVKKRLATDSISLSIGYKRKVASRGNMDEIPRTGGSMRLPECTNSFSRLLSCFMSIYDRTTLRDEGIGNIGISMGGLVAEGCIAPDLFTDTEQLLRERSLMSAIVDIKERFGKNAILKGVSFEAKATARARNLMVGGHSSGDQ